MGKKLSISIPTIIDTELVPLDDNFWLSANGGTEQWYYENTSTFSPDRTTTPLIITPNIKAIDRESGVQYTPRLYESSIVWKVTQFVNNRWITTTINSTTSSDPFYISATNLVVRKNNADATRGITISFSGQYIDPRGGGFFYNVYGEITLTTNRDASVLCPTIQILNPPTTTFNPLTNSSSQFTFRAIADWSNIPLEQGESQSNRGQFEWYSVDEIGDETLIENTDYYVSGQHTDTLVVDAMFGENIPIILRIKRHSTDQSPMQPKEYSNVTWRIPPLEGIVSCDNGSTVRSSDNKAFVFRTIVNLNGETLDEETIKENLAFKWNMRRATPTQAGASETPNDYGINGVRVEDLGWGYTISIDAKKLIYFINGKNASRLVSNDIYLRGANSYVSYNGDNVVFNGNNVIARIVDLDN